MKRDEIPDISDTTLGAHLEWQWPFFELYGVSEIVTYAQAFVDFEWEKKLGHTRKIFSGYMSLAHYVRDNRPDDKAVVLVLTDWEEASEGWRTDHDSYDILIVNIDNYLDVKKDDQASAYFAGLRGAPIINPGQDMEKVFLDLAQRMDGGFDTALDLLRLRAESSEGTGKARPEQALELVKRLNDLSSEDFDWLSEWVKSDKSKLFKLIDALHEACSVEDISDPRFFEFLFKCLERVDPEKLEAAIVATAGLDESKLRAFIRYVMQSEGGQGAVREELALSLESRLEEVDAQATAFEELLATGKAGETDCQKFLEKNPILLGLEYVKLRWQAPSIQGDMDFLLERVDGFHDLLEIKDPNDEVIVERPSKTEKSPPPSHYALSSGVANAIAQSHLYRFDTTEGESAMANNNLINSARHPKIIIIAGRDATLKPRSKRALEEFNRSLHRVEIITYDRVPQRAKMLTANVRDYLAARRAEEDQEENGA